MTHISRLEFADLKSQTAEAMSRSLSDIERMQAEMLCLNKRVIASRIILNASREALRTEIVKPISFSGL